MKRLIFLNRFFFPDHSATSQILSDLAFELARDGREVHVIASSQLYDDARARLAPTEVTRGVRIHRIPTTTFGRSALIGRAIDYLSFYVSMRRWLFALVERDDILIAKTDPPLISVLAMQAAQRRHAHLVNWLQDFYPDVAVELGVPFMRGPVSRGLSYLRDKSFKAAVANVVIGHRMADRLVSRGVAPTRVHIIPNWSDDEAISPVSHADNPLRREWGLANKFVVGYSGNLGRAHEFETVLAASERFRSDPRFIFLFIGGGHRLVDLEGRVKAHGLEALFRFVPYQDQAVLKYSLGVADVHWISLKPELEGLIVPSKFYGIAAAGRPVIAITAKDGEIARLIEQHQCGLVIEPGHANALADALVLLSNDHHRRNAMGDRARAMLETRFTRRHAFEQWRKVLDNIEVQEQRAG